MDIFLGGLPVIQNAPELGRVIAPIQHPEATANVGEIKAEPNVNVARKLNFNQDMCQSTELDTATKELAADIVSPIISEVRQPIGQVILPKNPANVENYAMKRNGSNENVVGPLPES